MSKNNILGIRFDDIGIAVAVERSMRAMEERSGAYVVTLDSQLALEVRKNRRLTAAVKNAGLVLPGDKGIFTASYILGLPLRNKMDGLDYSAALLARMSETGRTMFILGARPGVAERAAEELMHRFPGIRLAGTTNGDFVDDTEIKKTINELEPDLLIVCLSFPREELWMYENCSELNIGIAVGLGRVMEPFMGRKDNSSWFSRLLHDPKRTLKEPRMALAAVKKRLLG
ncbi:MAG: WecB/TagA/CpsF family glycosyltransferase [Candidatus Limivicinus sp.]|jgi:N-acetylglucosaminyldiphosphoundecaprenol N-acetyl-beta-D-mannosaminyltransferase